MENIIWVVLLCAVLALLFAAWKTSVVSKADAGTERMKEIAGFIRDFLHPVVTFIGFADP